jgi:hypothetical protein
MRTEKQSLQSVQYCWCKQLVTLALAHGHGATGNTVTTAAIVAGRSVRFSNFDCLLKNTPFVKNPVIFRKIPFLRLQAMQKATGQNGSNTSTRLDSRVSVSDHWNPMISSYYAESQWSVSLLAADRLAGRAYSASLPRAQGEKTFCCYQYLAFAWSPHPPPACI